MNVVVILKVQIDKMSNIVHFQMNFWQFLWIYHFCDWNDDECMSWCVNRCAPWKFSSFELSVRKRDEKQSEMLALWAPQNAWHIVMNNSSANSFILLNVNSGNRPHTYRLWSLAFGKQFTNRLSFSRCCLSISEREKSHFSRCNKLYSQF